MRTWFNMACILAVGIALTACASNVTTKARIGFEHAELLNEIDGTGDTNGWSVGGSLGLAFSEGGVSAVEPCVDGGLAFGNISLGAKGLKTTVNQVPATLCVEVDTTRAGGE